MLIDEALALHSHRVEEAAGDLNSSSTTSATKDLDDDHDDAPPDLESTYESPRWRPRNNHDNNDDGDDRGLLPRTAPPNEMTPCAHCSAPGAKQVCSGCRRAAYCGPACQRLAWTTGGHREACSNIREVKSAAAVTKALDQMPETQRTSRESRVKRMVPICVRIVELCIGFLCEGSDEDDDEEEEDKFSQIADDASTSGWTSLPPNALLALQQTLIDVMRSSIELLQDARAATNTTNRSTQRAAAGHGLLTRPCDQGLRAVAVECGRCLACWLAQESGALRDELTNAKALDLLLQISAYARPPSSSTTSSSSSAASWTDGDSNSADSDDEPNEEVSNSSSAQQPPSNERDVLVFLLPALTALCHEDEGGPLAVVNCGAVPVLASFVARELESSCSRKKEKGVETEVKEELSRGNNDDEMLTSVVMAMGLLFDLVASCATEIVSIDSFQGQLADLPCFAAILPCKIVDMPPICALPSVPHNNWRCLTFQPLNSCSWHTPYYRSRALQQSSSLSRSSQHW